MLRSEPKSGLLIVGVIDYGRASLAEPAPV